MFWILWSIMGLCFTTCIAQKQSIENDLSNKQALGLVLLGGPLIWLMVISLVITFFKKGDK